MASGQYNTSNEVLTNKVLPDIAQAMTLPDADVAFLSDLQMRITAHLRQPYDNGPASGPQFPPGMNMGPGMPGAAPGPPPPGMAPPGPPMPTPPGGGGIPMLPPGAGGGLPPGAGPPPNPDELRRILNPTG